MRTRVVIAGGGVAALEAALALREHGREVTVELLAPEPHFWYRPLAVAEPFGLGEARHFELAELAAAAGATFTLGTLRGVDADAHLALTSVGALSYDRLLIAAGAVPVAAVPGALTFRGPADSEKLGGLVARAVAGVVHRIGFAVPRGAGWSLPAYELALLTAAHLGERGLRDVEVALVTPEEEPLHLFGGPASEAVRRLLDERGIELYTSSHPLEYGDGELQLVPDGRLALDALVAMPRLKGERLAGVPQTLDGFIPVDPYGRLGGLDDVYAAGDVTAFPVKQGGIAAQQADVAAAAIAQSAGADVEPQPFRPVLRGLLLTGSAPAYLRRDLARRSEEALSSAEPLWWPPAKIVGRHLAPFLAAFAGVEPPAVAPPPAGAVEIEVELEPEVRAAPPVPDDADDGDTIAELMTSVLVVAPEDTLAEVAERMRAADVGSAVVADYGRLVGILTSRDLLHACAGRVHPSEARVRQWMTVEPLRVSRETPVVVAVRLMTEHGIHQLPVVDGELPIGLVGLRQAARAAAGTPSIGLGY